MSELSSLHQPGRIGSLQLKNKLAKELEGLVPHVYALGDCVKPNDAAALASSAGSWSGVS